MSYSDIVRSVIYQVKVRTSQHARKNLTPVRDYVRLSMELKVLTGQQALLLMMPYTTAINSITTTAQGQEYVQFIHVSYVSCGPSLSRRMIYAKAPKYTAAAYTSSFRTHTYIDRDFSSCTLYQVYERIKGSTG